MNDEKNKQFSIKFKPSLMAKVEEYIELVNSTKTEKEPKLTKATFFNRMVANYFNHMVLTNDFIALDKPLYFNSKELVEKGSIKCLNNKPTDLDNVFIVKRVPNNLDTLNKGFIDSISYYYEDSYRHKGIVFSGIPFLEEGLEAKFLVFDFDESTGKPELVISILKPEDLTTYLDIEKDKNLILELNEMVTDFKKDIEEAVEFYFKYDGIFSDEEAIKDVPEDVLRSFSKFGFNVVQYYCYNFNCFIPIRFYSKLQQLLIFLNKATPEELLKIEAELGVSKEELEVFITTFRLEDESDYKFNMFFMKLILNEKDLDFNKLVNGFLNEEEITVLIKNYFVNELE